MVKKYGGRVTSNFSTLTNFLIIGTSLGTIKIREGIQIVTLDQVNSVITKKDMTVMDLKGPYPRAATAILAKNGIQDQCLPDIAELLRRK